MQLNNEIFAEAPMGGIHMNLPFTESNYERLVLDLHAREEELEKELADVRERKEVAEKFRHVFDAWAAEKVPEPAGEGKRHSHLGPQDIAHCTSQHEALKEIARLSGGLVNPTEAASIVLDAGLSRGKKSSVVSTLSGYLAKDDIWEWVDAGVYRLRETAPVEEDESALTEVFESSAPPVSTDQAFPLAIAQNNHADGSLWGEPGADSASPDINDAA